MNPRNPAIRITVISVLVNLVLGILKCGVGLVAGSRALVADGLHSLSDLSTDVAVLAGLLLAAKTEDAKHPFGHHKFASLAKLFVGGMLLLFAVGLVVSAVFDFQSGPVVEPGWVALSVALLSLVSKEVMFFWTRYWGRRLRSDLLMANAWHHRTDSVSSLAVVSALIGVKLGGPSWAFLDSGVALVLGSFLVVEGARITKRAVDDLVDAAPEAEIIEDLREHILPTPGVVGYHDLRVRRIGDVYEMDLHIQVEPEISVEAGHQIAKAVKQNLLETHPEIFRVLIHIEPATDEHLLGKGLYGIEGVELPEER